MAQISNFISEFRAGVAAMLNSYDHVQALADKALALGWGEAEFAAALANSSDITGAELNVALEAARALHTANAASAAIFIKMTQ